MMVAFRRQSAAALLTSVLALGWLFFGALPSAQAATIQVDGTNCTLSQAITAANQPTGCGSYAGSTGADSIQFVSNLTSITLSAALPSISSEITIEGGGVEVNGNDTYRVLHVASGGKLTIKNLKVYDGRTSSANNGAGILVSGGGEAILIGADIKDNDSSNYGGGIHVEGSAKLTVRDSVIHGNQPGSGGGGIYIDSGGQATITGSAVRNNTANFAAGIFSDGSLTISNSTISDNNSSASNGKGGGIYMSAGSATLSHVTLWGNRADSNGSLTNATQIYIDGSSTTMALRNSIVCDGSAATHDLVLASGGSLSQNVGNVIGKGSAATTAACSSLGNRIGDPGYYIPPSGHSALGNGDDGICLQYRYDQPGRLRPETDCDSGAAERGGTNFIDVDSGCSFSQAIQNANDGAQTNTGCETGTDDAVAMDFIRLTANVSLSAAAQGVSSKVIVDGQGYAINSTGSVGVVNVSSGGELSMRNITVSGASKNSGGGAISVLGTLNLYNCVFKNNSTSASTGGGGALEYNSTATGGTIDRCAFISNRSSNNSGAIQIVGGTVTISNSTFYKNHSKYSGGAIRVGGGTAILSQLTVWDNTTESNAATTGIHGGGTTKLHNSIIGRSATAGGALCGGTFQNSNVERGIIAFNGSGCGTVTTGNPLLGAQTGRIPYLPLGAGSAAIGKGIAAECATYPTDQAGRARPATNCDSGAVQFVPGTTTAAADPGPPKTGGRWVQYADGSWHYVRPGEEGESERPVCTGEELNKAGAFKVSATYGLCAGVQFNQLELSAIGIGHVVEAGPLAAVDVWGWVTAHVELCYRGQVSMLFLDAATSPRTVSQLASVWDGTWTCAQISRAGTIVIMPAQSYLTSAPVNAAAPASLPDATPFGSCMVTLNYILNLRQTPGGMILMHLPYGVKLTAFQRSGDWVKVDYHGLRGWLSAAHVSFEGVC